MLTLPYFVNSSLAPVLLLRRRIKSVADVLRSIRQHDFSQGRWDALCGWWNSVCEQSPGGPTRIALWSPRLTGFLLIFMVSTKEFLMHRACLMTSLSRWWLLVGILG